MDFVKVKCPLGVKVYTKKISEQEAFCPPNCSQYNTGRKPCCQAKFNFTKLLHELASIDVEYNESDNKVLEHRNELPKNDISDYKDNDQRFDFINDEKEKDDTLFLNRFSDLEDDASSFSSSLNIINDDFESFQSSNSSFEDDLFFGIKEPALDEPCFEDGVKEFYEDPAKALYYSGNSSDALNYIYRRWLVDRVFSNDGKKIKRDFLSLLKVRGFQKNSNEIKKILDSNLNSNKKFFRLFYNIIYKNDTIPFIWSEKPNHSQNILPLFKSREEFIYSIIQNNNRDFLHSISKCLEEVKMYFNMNDENEDFFLTITSLAYEKYGVYINCIENKTLEINNLGNKDKFIQSLMKVDTLENLKLKYKFLEKFEILNDGSLKLRSKDKEFNTLNQWKDKKIDDSVYDLLGIMEKDSSSCKEAFLHYMMFVKTYMELVNPKSISIADVKLSSNNFYNDILSLIEEEGPYLSMTVVEKNASKKTLYKLDFVKSLLDLGIIENYVKLCGTSKLDELVDFINNRTLKKYFTLTDVKKYSVYRRGEIISINEYINKLIKEDFDILNKDNVLATWLDAKIINDKNSEAVREKLKKCDEKITKLL